MQEADRRRALALAMAGLGPVALARLFGIHVESARGYTWKQAEHKRLRAEAAQEGRDAWIERHLDDATLQHVRLFCSERERERLERWVSLVAAPMLAVRR